MGAWKQRRRDPRTLEERRKEAVGMLLPKEEGGSGLSQEEVAERLRVTPSAVSRWWKAYVDAGMSMDALDARKHTGRPRVLSEKHADQLAEMLPKGAEHYGFETDLWTTERVSRLIEEKFGISYHPDHVRKILHRMDFSSQKPERVARERDEKKVRDWVRNVLPDIKKAG